MSSVPQNLPATHDSGATPTVAPSTAPKPEPQSNNNPTTNPPSHSSNAPNSSSDSAPQSQAPPDQDSSYPEQKHAGAVGYGPNYRKNPTIEEKIEGLKDELKGKITRNPALVQHGRDIMSGEERKRKLQGEDEPSPLQSVDADEKRVNGSGNEGDQQAGQQGQQPSGPSEPAKSQSTDQSQRHAQTPQTQPSDQSGPLQAAPTSSPFVTLQDNNSQSQNKPANSSHDASPPTSSLQPSQETTGTRSEFATHGAPRPNPAGMALDQGQGEGAKEQAATVTPQGTREAEEQRKGNASEFTARPVDVRQ